MSELSTVAIKDGHRGHPHHLQSAALSDLRVPGWHTNPDSERADRISRLAGLERLGAVRSSSSASLPPGASANNPSGLNHFESAYMIPPGGAHALSKERSTVGSASATASVGDAGSAYTYDEKDKMSESGSQSQSVGGDAMERDAMEHDMDDMEAGTVSSVGFGDAMSDNASLVGWGGGERGGSPVAASVVASQGSKVGTPAGTPAPERFGGKLGGGGAGAAFGRGSEEEEEDVRMD